MFMVAEAKMPKKIEWTEAQDATIRRMRTENASWDCIAAEVGVTRWTVIERGRRLGARPPTPDEEPAEEDPERPPLPPGHADTWDPIVKGTSLEGMPYPIPAPVR
jgi:hypothetical protein